MIWKGSDDLSADLFTGALYGEHYGPPDKLDFDIWANDLGQYRPWNNIQVALYI